MKNYKIFEDGLIKVYKNENEEQIVDARELFNGLRSNNTQTKFTDWISEKINKYGFVENTDFISFSQKNEKGGRPTIEYALTLDTAKEIAMVENNEQGRKIRRYFIEVEKKSRKMFAMQKVKKEYHKPIDRAIKQHFNIAQTIIQATGVKPGIAYSVAISEAEKETGYQYGEYKKLLPSAEHDVASYNPTKLGEKLGIKAQEVNKRLETLGLQEKKEKKWRITEQGKQFGEEMPFTRNGHTDYRILWHEKVLEKLGGTANV